MMRASSHLVAAALAGAVASDPDGPLAEGFRIAVDDLAAAVQTRRPHADAKDVVADVALMVGSLELSRATRDTKQVDDAEHECRWSEPLRLPVPAGDHWIAAFIRYQHTSSVLDWGELDVHLGPGRR